MSRSSIQNRPNCKVRAADIATFSSGSELNQLLEVASGTSLEFVQLRRGKLRGKLTHLDLGLSSVHANAFSVPVRGRGAVSAERWNFVVFPDRVAGIFNGIALAPSIVLAYRPGSEFDGSTHGGLYEDWTITVKDAALRDVAQCLFQQELPSIRSTCVILRPDPNLLVGLRILASEILALGLASNQLSFDSPSRESLHWRLTEQLARVVMCGQAETGKVNRRVTSHLRTVRMSEDYLSGNINAPVTVARLCAAADVSERTLRRAYQSVLGLSPSAYLKARRLQLARVQLEQSTAKEATVTRIALSSGFGHMGHFSRDYHDFFGESPSQTLATSSTG